MRLPIAVLVLASATAATAAETPPADLPSIHPGIPRYAFKPQIEDYYATGDRQAHLLLAWGVLDALGVLDRSIFQVR